MREPSVTKNTERISGAQLRHLLGGPLLAMSVMLAVAWLARPMFNGVLHNDSVMQLDLTLLHWFRSHATNVGDTLFVFISLLGAPVTMGAVSLVGAVLIYRQSAWRLLVVWITANIGSSALTEGIKHMFNRPRPEGAERFLHGTSYSFPSGHAVGSMVVLGMALVVVAELWTKKSREYRVARIVVPAMIGAIGLSRLALGVHYLSDVLGGFVIGGVWLGICTWVARENRAEF